MKWICCIGLVMLTALLTTNAQVAYHAESDQSSARKQADTYFERQAYRHAAVLYHKMVEAEPECWELKLKLADCHRMLKENRIAAFWYERALHPNRPQTAGHWLHYVAVLCKLEKYHDARFWCSKYLQQFPGNQKATAILTSLMDLAKYDRRDTFTVHLLPIDVAGPVFSPALNEGGLVFVAPGNTGGMAKKIAAWNETPYFDLYYVKLVDGNPGSPVYFDNRINSIYHEGPAVFFNHDSEVIFTRSSSGKDRKSSRHLQLMSSEHKPNGGWSDPQPLPFNDKNYSNGHPALDRDGSTLYFASNRPGGYGGSDLYKSKYEYGMWQAPVNLGPSVNTAGNELFPFFGIDGVLYFSSDGRGGLGGLDLFKFDIEKPQHPENLGFPLNSSADDFGIIWDNPGKSGYFSSNRGGMDKIFSFSTVSY